MDGGVRLNAFTDFLGKITGNDGPTVTQIPAQPLSGYPSVDDAREASRHGFGYGTGNEPFIEGKAARVMGRVNRTGEFQPRSAVGMSPSDAAKTVDDETQSQMFDLNKMKNWDVRKELGPVFAQAALAANRNPIAALGFDPNRTVMDIMLKKGTIGGAYMPSADAIYANVSDTDPSSVVHESMHRGIKRLKEYSPRAKELIEKQLPDEESVVRWMMHSTMGDPEKNLGSISDKQRAGAIWYFDPKQGGWQGTRQKALAELMDIAATMRKEQRPGGPR